VARSQGPELNAKGYALLLSPENGYTRIKIEDALGTPGDRRESIRQVADLMTDRTFPTELAPGSAHWII